MEKTATEMEGLCEERFDGSRMGVENERERWGGWRRTVRSTVKRDQ